jgi:polyisoprenoid-binding protein YceI
VKSLVVPIFTAALLALGPAALAQETAPEWAMKRAESALTFTADQSGSPIEGRFERFEAAIFFDPADPEAGRVEVTIHMASATTDDSMRDDTLKSEDLFHVEAYPTATFSADRFEKADGDDAYRAPGELTLRGVTRPVTLPFTLAIEGEGPGATAHAEGTITIDRLDFGVGQGDWAETDTVADPVDIGIDIRAVRQ